MEQTTTKAVICPVCGGYGTTRSGETCHGCEGKGWVTVQEKYHCPPPFPQPGPPSPPGGPFWEYQPWKIRYSDHAYDFKDHSKDRSLIQMYSEAFNLIQ